MEELKNCPFCGSTVIFVRTEDEIFESEGRETSGYYTAICDAQKGGCGASSGYEATKEKAIKTWNMRVENKKRCECESKGINKCTGKVKPRTRNKIRRIQV